MSDPRRPDASYANEIDPGLVERYRAASREAGGTPNPDVRAAVLAAATRAVGGGPQAVDETPVVRAPTHRRWPVAAAAAVVLSSIAALLATHVDRETNAPESVVPNDGAGLREAAPSVASPAAVEAPKAADTKPAEAMRRKREASAEHAAPAFPAQQAPAPAASAARPPVTTIAPSAPSTAVPASRAVEPSANTSAPASVREERAAKATAVPTPTPPRTASPAPAAPATVTSPAAAGAVAAPASVAPAESAPTAPPAPKREATVRSLSNDAAGDSPAKDLESDPQRWVAYIVKLRAEGKDADAEAQIRRFRARYPEAELPASALAPAADR